MLRAVRWSSFFSCAGGWRRERRDFGTRRERNMYYACRYQNSQYPSTNFTRREKKHVCNSEANTGCMHSLLFLFADLGVAGNNQKKYSSIFVLPPTIDSCPKKPTKHRKGSLPLTLNKTHHYPPHPPSHTHSLSIPSIRPSH